MGISKHLKAICYGGGIGFCVGLASFLGSADKTTMAIMRIVLKPIELVMWLAQTVFGLGNGTTAFIGWFGSAIYCMILGVLIGWGISVLYSRATGDE
jgi:hypothetical protein